MSSIYRKPESNTTPEVMNMQQALEFLNLGRTTLTQLLKAGHIPAFKAYSGARPWKFRRSSLEQWMRAITDPTRSTSVWRIFSNPQDFVHEQMEEEFLKDYRRNLQQTQPLHIEVVAEKLTVQNILKPVCSRFGIPLTITRGFVSLPPRDAIATRFLRSGKEKLLLLVISDLDLDGVSIGETFLQSMREDFGIDECDAVRVALTLEQVERFGLPEGFEAKESSSRYNAFVSE